MSNVQPNNVFKELISPLRLSSRIFLHKNKTSHNID